jgi:LytS/YehU family sensor histidine kinase
VLVWLVRRYPLERGRWPRSLLVLSLAVALTLALRIAGIMTLNPWLGWYDELPSVTHLAMLSLTYNLFLAWMIIGVAHALLFAERARQRERHAASLETHLAQARLQALSARLNPHFLFNTLNTIAEQVHRNPDAADRMLVGLGALLRRNLDDDAGTGVTLGDELELLSQYLDIEKMRLGDRLQIDWQIAPETLDARVPHLLLQPLAENAIHHAISRRTTSGRLTVRSMRRDTRLVLEIEDDGGPQIMATNGNGHGIGLSTTRARLQYQYGDDHALSIDTDDGGTHARIDVPFAHDTGRTQ